eukprot:3586599-Rhodomonas_salina.1
MLIVRTKRKQAGPCMPRPSHVQDQLITDLKLRDQLKDIIARSMGGALDTDELQTRLSYGLAVRGVSDAGLTSAMRGSGATHRWGFATLALVQGHTAWWMQQLFPPQNTPRPSDVQA